MNIRNLLTWLTTSSADPAKTSATLKGVLKIVIAKIIYIGVLACSFGVACAFGDLSWLNDAADLIGTIAYGVLIVWGAGQGVFGLIRKIYLGRWAHPAAAQQ
ncbi:MAG: hypothetical protein BGP12_06880 [Rhodospirillales bacterium 70-18]|nr:MAG: hypothetical protein BGP12_06880 [Rhodospirillales bacterium 70-18]